MLSRDTALGNLTSTTLYSLPCIKFFSWEVDMALAIYATFSEFS